MIDPERHRLQIDTLYALAFAAIVVLEEVPIAMDTDPMSPVFEQHNIWFRGRRIQDFLRRPEFRVRQ